MDEQQDDVVRHAQLKVLAAEADARWEAKPRPMDLPPAAEKVTATRKLPQFDAAAAAQAVGGGDASQHPTPVRVKQNSTAKQQEKVKVDDKEDVEDPWAKARPAGPSEGWQPAAWDPSPSKKRQ